MKYGEMLNICETNRVSGAQIYIAYEMEYQLVDICKLNVDSSRFERLCEFAYNCYLKAEGLAMVQIVKCIAQYQNEHVKDSGKDPLEMEKWDVLNVAGCYEF